MTKPAFHVCALTGVEAFREGILFCQHSLEALGYPVTVGHGQLNPDAINILFGSYVSDWKTLSAQAQRIIVYNWEQVSPEVPWFTQKYFRQMINAQVWDYNRRNVSELEKVGIQNIQFVPLGYVPQLQRQAPKVEQDIDVLFYGTVNGRRKQVLDAIRAKGLNVVSTEEGRYLLGEDRDVHIARAKVVLNIHFYETAGIFEIARVSYLLANHKAVVSELAPHTDIEDDIKSAIVHGSLEDLPDLCVALVKDEVRRREVEAQAFAIFSKREGADIMRQTLARYFALHPSHAITPFQASSQSNTSIPQVSTPSRLPKTLRIGAGDRWRFDQLNIDPKAEMGPDFVLDISKKLPLQEALSTWRFGQISLREGMFKEIIAENVFQTYLDVPQALANCLLLLEEGGDLQIEVPHDLSIDAWAKINNVRAFNEKSWKLIADNWWEYGGTTHRFELVNQSNMIRSGYGAKKLEELNNNWDEIVKVPRAVDAVRVWLRKQALTDEEKKQLPQVRFTD